MKSIKQTPNVQRPMPDAEFGHSELDVGRWTWGVGRCQAALL